jgi:hypothetical protein
VDAELHVGGSPGGPRRQPHARQQLVGPARRLPGAADEIVERQLAAPAGRYELDVGVERQEQGREIAVGIGERQIAADGADVPHAHVGHVARDRRDERVARANEG